MNKVLKFLLCSFPILIFPAKVSAAISDAENGLPGTVDYFTSAQKARAFGAATKTGYTPIMVEAYQDGNFFLTANKNGQTLELTVVPSGQVYPSAPTTPAT